MLKPVSRGRPMLGNIDKVSCTKKKTGGQSLTFDKAISIMLLLSLTVFQFVLSSQA